MRRAEQANIQPHVVLMTRRSSTKEGEQEDIISSSHFLYFTLKTFFFPSVCAYFHTLADLVSTISPASITQFMIHSLTVSAIYSVSASFASNFPAFSATLKPAKAQRYISNQFKLSNMLRHSFQDTLN